MATNLTTKKVILTLHVTSWTTLIVQTTVPNILDSPHNHSDHPEEHPDNAEEDLNHHHEHPDHHDLPCGHSVNYHDKLVYCHFIYYQEFLDQKIILKSTVWDLLTGALSGVFVHQKLRAILNSNLLLENVEDLISRPQGY